MNNKIFVFLTVMVGSGFLSSQGYAEEAACKTTEIENISLSHVTIVATGADFNVPRDDFVKKIQAVADELKLQAFKLQGNDYSAYRNSYTNEAYEYSMSFSMSFVKDARAVNAFMQKLMPMSISSSVSTQECP